MTDPDGFFWHGGKKIEFIGRLVAKERKIKKEKIPVF